MVMPSVRCTGLEFAYRDGVPLLRDVTLHLQPGWYGLVAENGAGKTTFLRLLSGELEPDRGVIVRDGRSIVCAQEVEHPGPAVWALAARADHQACALRGRLALEDPGRWESLSPGERKRWQVAGALAEEPDILLLDEPTNHLDGQASEQLALALAEHRGLGVVVSHDRALLDRLTSETLRLQSGHISLTPGAYSTARALWESEARRREEERQRARGQVRRLERQLDRQRRDQEAASRDLSTRHRMRNIHDSDARTPSAHTRVEWAQASLGRGMGATRSQLERARADAAAGLPPERALGSTVFARYQPARRNVLLSLDRPVIEVGARPLLRDINLTLHRQDRVWLSGNNGAGKSTLVNALLAHHTLPADKLLCLPQELTETETAALLSQLRAAPPDEKGRILSVVAALNSDPARLLATRRPSPGEARKLAIAFALGRHVWALVLDEPTNHLDLPSVERLEQALTTFPGALLLVTHDTSLAHHCTTTRWHLHDNSVQVT
jgi:ATPase subunit of ABC transporter with duplicated ATPase domains